MISNSKIFGFSLVEISIVLVILGLLTGGIIGGQSLIRAAELRSVTNELSTLDTAMKTFRDKYFSVPGDMREATRFWFYTGSSTPECVTYSAASTGNPGTCDGDGDGVIEMAAASTNPGHSGEDFQVWRHLQLAGLISGQNSGVHPSGGPYNVGGLTLDKNFTYPSKLNGAHWTAVGDFTKFAPSNFPTIPARTNMYFLYGNGYLGAVMTQAEAWNIDTKFDDGRPMAGRMVASAQSWGGMSGCIDGFPIAATYYDVDQTSGGCLLAVRLE